MKQWDAANETVRFNTGADYAESKTGIRRWNYGPMSMVKANMRSTGFVSALTHLKKGKVEDTLYAHGPLPAPGSEFRPAARVRVPARTSCGQGTAIAVLNEVCATAFCRHRDEVGRCVLVCRPGWRY